MTREFRPYVPQSIGELTDLLKSMVLGSPRFADNTGYFPGQSLGTTFDELNSALDGLRSKLGEDRYRTLAQMSVQVRANFEADPDDETGDAIKGRELILDMLDLIKARRSKPRG